MNRWHQFHNGQADPHFGFGTVAQAQDHWLALYDRGTLHTHKLTTLGEREEPPNDALVVNLNTGEFLHERHRRGTAHGL